MLHSLMRTHRKPEAEVSLTFVGRSLIRRLNREYLGHDYVTDVISFSLSEPEEAELVGDIYICLPRAEQQAAWYGAPAREELVRLAAHGTLHLLGYDHEKPEEAARMNELQEACVDSFRAGRYDSAEGGRPAEREP
ncbi:rRNA maturation RNase YbeY [bacterium]|nr:rRNA maturation RNase YbeY [bacterium]